MDFNHNYIPDEIILHVFDQLNITSKIQFIFVNHYTLTHYYPYLKEMI